MTTTAWLDELERLEKAATGGPWCCHQIGIDSISVSAMTNVGVSAYSTLISFCPTEQNDGEGRTWETDGSIEGNRQFVAALRNAAPALIAAARREAKMRSGLEMIIALPSGARYTEAQRAYQAALETIKNIARAALEPTP